MIGDLIDRRMILQILAVLDRCLPDLTDRRIDPMNRFDLILRLRPITRPVLDHPAGSAQIGESMQIIGMRTEIIRTGGGIRPDGSEKTNTRYRTSAEKTLHLQLNFHVKEILSLIMNPDL